MNLQANEHSHLISLNEHRNITNVKKEKMNLTILSAYANNVIKTKMGKATKFIA